jgi:hypothetical protein
VDERWRTAGQEGSGDRVSDDGVGMVLRVEGPSPVVSSAPEPTLGELLTHFARTTVPSRLYKFLQFGIPFALDFGLHGYWRAAAWGVAIASLGAWGLVDRRLFTTAPPSQREHDGLLRYARAITGSVAVAIPAILLIEIFLHLLGNAPIS